MEDKEVIARRKENERFSNCEYLRTAEQNDRYRTIFTAEDRIPHQRDTIKVNFSAALIEYVLLAEFKSISHDEMAQQAIRFLKASCSSKSNCNVRRASAIVFNTDIKETRILLLVRFDSSQIFGSRRAAEVFFDFYVQSRPFPRNMKILSSRDVDKEFQEMTNQRKQPHCCGFADFDAAFVVKKEPPSQTNQPTAK